jgi:uncharacterized protein
MVLTLAKLRRYAIARSLFAPTSLPQALQNFGFVQADPMRAPARAQDLILRHRVIDYRAGQLERDYRSLAIEEDFFVNYGFVTAQIHQLMHPRQPIKILTKASQEQALQVHAYVREQGEVHPKAVDAHFRFGAMTHGFGGESRASTVLLNRMHYQGQLRVAERQRGIRVYAARDAATALRQTATERERMDRLVDLIVSLYAPLPAASLAQLIAMLRFAAPQWKDDRKRALGEAKARLGHGHVAGVDWYWPTNEDPLSTAWNLDHQVRLLAPFDPIVWDRRRFELFWGWAYRFEAYVPAPKRVLGHYALPLLWRDEVIGWSTLSVQGGRLRAMVGFVGDQPTAPGFKPAVDQELQRMNTFLGLDKH